MTVSIRPATPADHTVIESIETAADRLLLDLLAPGATPPPGWEPAPAGAVRAARPGLLLVADAIATGSPVGFVHVEVRGVDAHLEQISVLPEHGGRGVGRALVEAAAMGARSLGCERITLRTFADVPFNAPFYRSCGFTEIDASEGAEQERAHEEERAGLSRLGRRVSMARPLGGAGPSAA